MAAPPTVINSAAHIPGASQMTSPVRSFDFLLSGAVSYRALDVLQIPQGAKALWAGSFVDASGAPSAAPGGIAGITCYSYNPVDGPVNATCITRDAEVIDAYLQYGAMDPVAVNARLATLGIIVRAAVLRNVMPPGFAPDVPPAGPPISGIQSTEAPPDGEQPVDETQPPPPDTIGTLPVA